MTVDTRASARSRGRTSLRWLAGTTARRAWVQWRPLAVVGVVALVVTTLVSTLALLVTTAEDHAVRSAFAAAPAQTTAVAVRAASPTVPLDELATTTETGLGQALGVPLGADETSATSDLRFIPRVGRLSALASAAVLDGLETRATLVEGSWVADAPDPAPGAVPVTAPVAAAEVLDLEVGDEVVLEDARGEDPIRLALVGLFEPDDPTDPWWDRDRLDGTGHNPAYPVFGGTAFTDLVGPFVTTADHLDASGLGLTEATLRFTPDLSEVQLDDLPALDQGARDAALLLADTLGRGVSTVRLVTDLDDLTAGASAALVVTRSGVVVVVLLLLVLATATLVQTARLLAEARKPGHELMRARGASRRQLVAAGAMEGLVVGAGAAVLGTLVSAQVYEVLVRGTRLDAPGAVPLGELPWLVTVGMAVLVAVVGVSPLLGPGDTFVEAEQEQARPQGRAAIARVGADGVLVALAAVAYWQLRTYRSPLTASDGELRLDPVLVAGPAIVLVAATLLSLRLFPAGAWVAERFAARGRGIVGALAAWEVGRRAARAATAALLLTVAVAVATFSQSLLATWSASQQDQVEHALGAPVVVSPAGAPTGVPVALTGPDGEREAEPVVRTTGELTVWVPGIGPGGGGRDVGVLAGTEAARELLDRRRVADEGGAEVASLPPAPAAGPSEGIVLPEDAVGLAGEIRVKDSGRALAGAGTVAARLLVEDSAGLVSSLALPIVPAETVAPFEVLLEGAVPPADGSAWEAGERRGPVRVVGLQVLLVAAPDSIPDPPVPPVFAVEVSLGALSAILPTTPEEAQTDLRTPDATLERLEVPELPLDVQATTGAATSAAVLERASFGLAVGGLVTALEGASASASIATWPVGTELPAVLTSAIANRLELEPGDSLGLRVDGVDVRLVVDSIVPRVPTQPDGEQVVLDHTSLARALAAGGSWGTAADEWWVDVPAPAVEGYLASLPGDGHRALEQDAETVVGTVEDLREGPLRVALPLALRLVTLGAAVVAALGFAVHTAMTLRSRDLELAQLRAVGLRRSTLVGAVTAQSLLVGAFGALVGVGVGALLALTVAPLVSVAADGGPPVPEVLVHIPWPMVGLVVAALVGVVAATAVGVSRSQRTADPAAILRQAADR